MNILVVGCGKIGTAVLQSLMGEGHKLTVIDREPGVVADVTNMYDVIGYCGNGADYESLEEAGVAKADLLVACTDSDEVNMLCCFLAGRMGAKHTIARIRNPEYNDGSLHFMKEHLGLAMAINPEKLAAEELYNILKLPSAAKVETFSRRHFEMIELRLREDSTIQGASLSELRSRFSAKFLICLVQRGNEVYIPDGSFVLQGGDRIGLMASHNELQKLLKAMKIQHKHARNVMILGGSRTAYYLAKKLTAAGNDVKIIESDRALCEDLCEGLSKAVVINGDGAHQELLLEEGLREMDAFVALTGMDEENILLSAFASSQNVPKVIAKVSRDELGSLAERLGLECVVSPRKIIADVLVRYARALANSRGGDIETLYTLADDRVEAVEFLVREDFRALNKPLKELTLQPNTLLAGIIRGHEAIIPTGNDCIRAGDRVVVMAADRRLQSLDGILK